MDAGMITERREKKRIKEGGRVKETVIKYRRDRCADEGGGGSNGRKKHQKREKSDTIAHNRSNFQRFCRQSAEQADRFSRYLMPTEAGLLLDDCFSPPAATSAKMSRSRTSDCNI